MVVIAVPVKSFDAAKRRLGDALGERVRRRLSRELARRTVRAVVAAGARPLVLAADEEVAGWTESEAEVRLDRGSTLDQAARGAVDWAATRGLAWAVCHADLPLLRSADLVPAVRSLASGRGVISPSSDGGTSLLGAVADEFAFSYGPGSFHRHLGLAPGALVHTALGLSLDLDTAWDLEAAAGHPDGAWLRPLLADG